MSAELFVSIDGGKSATRVCVTDADSRERWRGVGPGFSYAPGSSAVHSMMDAIRSAMALALPLTGTVRTCAGLSGLPGHRGERDALRTALADLFEGEILLVEDVLTAHAGALGGPGTVVSAGTGTTVLSISPSGKWARRDGWGPVIGDRGSGYDIGRAALRAAAASRDGTEPPTALETVVFDALGGSDLAALQRFYHDPEQVARVSRLAGLVVTRADGGDAVAAAICADAASALAATTISAATAAHADTAGSLVSYSGRLFTLGRSLLGPFRTLVEQAGMCLAVPAGDGLLGGLLLLRGGAAATYAAVVQDMRSEDL